MQKNWWKAVETFYNSGKMSGLVMLALPANDKKEAAGLQITKGKIKVRLVRAELESVDIEILLTSLANENVFAPGSQAYRFRRPV